MSNTRTSWSLPVMVLALVASGGSTPAYACPSNPYVASVCLTAAKSCPRGYSEADGQTLSISEFSELYQVIGTTFGGDGTTTFGLPALRDRAPEPGLRYCIAVSGLMSP